MTLKGFGAGTVNWEQAPSCFAVHHRQCDVESAGNEQSGGYPTSTICNYSRHTTATDRSHCLFIMYAMPLMHLQYLHILTANACAQHSPNREAHLYDILSNLVLH